jgi:hypothetical protein
MVVVATLAAGSIAASALGAVKPPTGDTDAINFFRSQADAYLDVPGVKIVQTGYFFVRKGKGTSVDYSWGQRPSDAAYKPAKATILARLLEGKVVAFLAKLQAPKVRTVRMLMAGGTVYISTTRCWKKSEPAASPFGTGEKFIFNDGGAHYSPLKESGSRTAVTFTYAWTPGSSASETSTFGPGKAPAFDVTITVSGRDRLSVHKWVTPLAKTPALPVPPPPLRPQPKPICPAETPG